MGARWGAAASTSTSRLALSWMPQPLWTPQHPLQPLPPLVGDGSFPGALLGIGPIREHRGRSGAAAGCHHRQSPAQGLQPQEGGAAPPLIGRTKGELTSKRPVVCHKQGRPVRLLLSQGQCSDFTGAEPLLRDLPDATTLMGDKRLGQRQDPHQAAGAGHHPLHPLQTEPQQEAPCQQEALQDGPYGWEPVCQAEGLATQCHPLPPPCPYLPLCRPPGSHSHLLVIRPEPGSGHQRRHGVKSVIAPARRPRCGRRR